LEFTAIKERLMATFFASDFLIPILIGNAKILEDIPSYLGFYQHKTVDTTVDMLVQKISTGIAEDTFSSNIRNCIDYICQQVCYKLSKKGVRVSLETSFSMLFQGDQQSFTLRFSADTIAQLPCILIYKEPNTSALLFPEFVITWKRQENIFFSIHGFNDLVPESNERQTICNVVDYICCYAENSLGG
jgi:hypothetical protein